MRFVARQAEQLDDWILLAHLPWLAGTANCPHCTNKISIWPELLHTF
ncbi:hypothetical protein [Paenibacillus sp. GCM10027626]